MNRRVHFLTVAACCSLTPAVCLVLSLMSPVGAAAAENPETHGCSIYDAQSQHLWNRLHAALFVRTGPQGRSYGADRIEPLLWNESKYLLEGASAKHAAAVLQEFVRDDGATLIADPLKRAILQRDLWLVFNWLAARPESDAKKRLETLIARAIDRLALPADRIAKLPDNYALAVSSKAYSDRFDPSHPQRSYLPPKLLTEDGPWVCIGRQNGPTAPFHLREGGSNRFSNSAFFVFLKLLGGRANSLDFARRLEKFDEPILIPNTDQSSVRRYALLPNPAMPQWPEGTVVALVRKALLIDDSHRVVVSPLTESVQLRVVLKETGQLTSEILSRVRERRGTGGQAFFEFQLRRIDLFGKVAGGLRDVSSLRDFKTGFNSHGWDEFDRSRETNRPFPEAAQPFVNQRASCVGCHSFPGVYGFNSISGFQFGDMRLAPRGPESQPQKLTRVTMKQVGANAIRWKTGQPGWKSLRNLMRD